MTTANKIISIFKHPAVTDLFLRFGNDILLKKENLVRYFSLYEPLLNALQLQQPLNFLEQESVAALMHFLPMCTISDSNTFTAFVSRCHSGIVAFFRIQQEAEEFNEIAQELLHLLQRNTLEIDFARMETGTELFIEHLKKAKPALDWLHEVIGQNPIAVLALLTQRNQSISYLTEVFENLINSFQWLNQLYGVKKDSSKWKSKFKKVINYLLLPLTLTSKIAFITLEKGIDLLIYEPTLREYVYFTLSNEERDIYYHSKLAQLLAVVQDGSMFLKMRADKTMQPSMRLSPLLSLQQSRDKVNNWLVTNKYGLWINTRTECIDNDFTVLAYYLPICFIENTSQLKRYLVRQKLLMEFYQNINKSPRCDKAVAEVLSVLIVHQFNSKLFYKYINSFDYFINKQETNFIYGELSFEEQKAYDQFKLEQLWAKLQTHKTGSFFKLTYTDKEKVIFDFIKQCT